MSGDNSNSNHSVGWSARSQGEKMDLTTSSRFQAAADSADWLLDGDFTIEMFGVEFTDVSANRVLCAQDAGSGSQRAWIFHWHATNGLEFIRTTDGSTLERISAAFSPSINTPYDLAVDRSSGTVRLYQGGSVLGSGALSGMFDSNQPLTIGRLADGAGSGLFRYRAIRITKDVARYAGAYTVPTLPLPTS